MGKALSIWCYCAIFSLALSVSAISQTLKVGQKYQGGIIFFLDSTGKHGLIAAPYDIGAYPLVHRTEWEIKGAEGIELGTGRRNTVNILKFSVFRGDTAPYYCATFNNDGYHDWFLPSIDELDLLFGAGVNIGYLEQGFYWSSSVAARYYGWAQSFYMSDTRLFMPYLRLNVRPIRAF